jgi:hypothetical protein
MSCQTILKSSILSMLGALLLAGLAAKCQTTRQAILTWDYSGEATFDIHRANGTCANKPHFDRLADNVTETTYTDTPPVGGTYAYVVTAVVNGIVSHQSNCVSVTVAPPPPTGLTGVAQ